MNRKNTQFTTVKEALGGQGEEQKLAAGMQALHKARTDRLTYEEHRRREKLRSRAYGCGYRLTVIRRKYWLQHVGTGAVVLEETNLETTERYIGERWRDRR